MDNFQNQTAAEPIRNAQAKGWIDEYINPQMFHSWLISTINGQLAIELDESHPASDDLDFIAKRAVCRLLGIDDPKPIKQAKPRHK